MGERHFEKYEGLGNDFVIIEAQGRGEFSSGEVRRICDRRLGIGADGVLLVLPGKSSGADGRMVVLNADGSVPEMCGNGLRCVALHVARKRKLDKGTLVFDTDAGVKPCVLEPGGIVTVDMGVVHWTSDIVLDAGGERWELALGDAGNPHAITRRVSTRAEIERFGPLIEKHPRFPTGTNVEFTVMRSATEIDLVVWERGVGVTQACGTGACATVAVAVKKGWSPSDTEVTVKLPGGALYIRMDRDGHAIMRGPARHVFSGELGPLK